LPRDVWHDEKVEPAVTIGSLFSGVGGFELGLGRAGLGPVLWQIEINEFRRRVLAKHWPEVMRSEDVRTATDLPRVDVICGGFPCTDLSTANPAAQGLAGSRSGLWGEFARIVGELRPQIVLVENVHGAWRRWLPHVRRDLWGLGYASVPLRVRASEVGALHIRARVFVVAYSISQQLRLKRGRGSRPDWQGALRRAVDGVNAANSQIERRDERRIQQTSGRSSGERLKLGGVRHSQEGAIEPTLVRGVHGVSRRVDRVASLGDSIYPACAEAIGRLVMEVLVC
jgi:DNA (cytosine-5)-methyltransferase 1